jgi:hypothetical protein
MKGHKSSIANFSEILDTVVKRPTCALRCSDGDTKPDGAGQCVENAEKCLCLIRGAVLVNGDKYVVVTKDGRDAEEGCKKVWDDVERIIQVDGEKVLVLSTRKIASMIIKRGLLLTWARNWVKAAETKIKKPRFRGRGVVSNKEGVSIACLSCVLGIEISGALASVVR